MYEPELQLNKPNQQKKNHVMTHHKFNEWIIEFCLSECKIIVFQQNAQTFRFIQLGKFSFIEYPTQLSIQ